MRRLESKKINIKIKLQTTGGKEKINRGDFQLLSQNLKQKFG